MVALWFEQKTLRSALCCLRRESTKWVLKLPTERLIAHAASPGEFPSSRLIITPPPEAPHRCGSGKSDRLILNSAWTRLPLRMPETEGGRCCLIISARSHQGWSVNSGTISIIVIIIMVALVVRPPSLWLITPPAAPVFWQGITPPSQTLVQQGSFSLRGYWIPGICMNLIFIKYHQQTPECLSGRESASETSSFLLCLL